jgi:hypothetical protein
LARAKNLGTLMSTRGFTRESKALI